jgi:hypothetical protein
MPQAQKIDEVVEALTAIIDDSLARESRMGYFAGLYRKVTISVRDKIAEGFFDDGPDGAARCDFRESLPRCR